MEIGQVATVAEEAAEVGGQDKWKKLVDKLKEQERDPSLHRWRQSRQEPPLHSPTCAVWDKSPGSQKGDSFSFLTLVRCQSCERWFQFYGIEPQGVFSIHSEY